MMLVFCTERIGKEYISVKDRKQRKAVKHLETLHLH